MGKLSESTISNLFGGDVTFKKGKEVSSRRRIEKITRQTPEVMVKVTGHTKDGDHAKAHLDYISRHGKVELEDERGIIIKSKDDVKKLAESWASDKVGKRTKKSTNRLTTSIVFSMPPMTDRRAVKNAVRKVAFKEFGSNYQYVMASHEDTEQPHAHLTVKCLGIDGKRLHIKRGDPQKWRETFAAELEKEGVEAEATPRAIRGIVKKGIGIKSAIHKMRARGIIPITDKEKVREAIEEIQGKRKTSKPWENKIKEKQTKIRKTWLQAAKELSKGDDEEGKILAHKIISFVKNMPPLKTERHEIKEKIINQIDQNKQEKEQDEER